VGVRVLCRGGTEANATSRLTDESRGAASSWCVRALRLDPKIELPRPHPASPATQRPPCCCSTAPGEQSQRAASLPCQSSQRLPSTTQTLSARRRRPSSSSELFTKLDWPRPMEPAPEHAQLLRTRTALILRYSTRREQQWA
jgi:hypothetical protein